MIPSEIVVMGQPFWVDVQTEPEGVLSNGEVLGRTNIDLSRMVINARPDKVSPIQVKDTLLHEVLHAIVKLDRLEDQIGESNEEVVVARLATHLLDTFRRNPALVKFLMAREN